MLGYSLAGGDDDVESLKFQIKEHYDTGKFSDALSGIAKLEEKDITSGILLLESNSLLELGQYNAAEEKLKQMIEENKAPNYTEKARWYLALLYLKSGQNQQAITLLEIIEKQENTFKHSEAKEVLRALR